MDDLFDISQITTNASDDVKCAIISYQGGFFQNYHVEEISSSFGGSILKRMKTAPNITSGKREIT